MADKADDVYAVVPERRVRVALPPPPPAPPNVVYVRGFDPFGIAQRSADRENETRQAEWRAAMDEWRVAMSTRRGEVAR